MVRSFAVQGQIEDRLLWNSWNSAEQAEILDAAIDFFLYGQAVATGKNDARAPVFQYLLALRNQLNVD